MKLPKPPHTNGRPIAAILTASVSRVTIVEPAAAARGEMEMAVQPVLR